MGNLTGSVGRVCNSYSRGCDFEPHVGCKHTVLCLLMSTKCSVAWWRRAGVNPSFEQATLSVNQGDNGTYLIGLLLELCYII